MRVERLQKVLSKAGITSRRKAEKLILEGKIKVNHQVVSKLGIKVDPEKDEILVDHKKLSLEKKVYLLLYKPKNYITTLSDNFKRPTVMDLIKDIKERVYPIGRLDYDTAGILLLTNNGDFSYQLTHPKFKVEKTYLVKFKNFVLDEKIKSLRRGVNLNDGLTLPTKVKVLQKKETHTWISITLTEGRNRQIKRMGEAIGHKVTSLKRIAYGCLRLGNLKEGQYRELTSTEISKLLKETK